MKPRKKPALTAYQRAFFRALSAEPSWPRVCETHVLVGGTTLAAFYFNHRLSEALDFFFDPTRGKEFPRETIRNVMRSAFPNAEYQIVDRDRNIFLIPEMGDFKVEFVENAVPQTPGATRVDCCGSGLRVAAVRDILLQKIPYFAGSCLSKNAIDLARILREAEFAARSPLALVREAADLFGHRGFLWSEPEAFLSRAWEADWDSLVVLDPRLTIKACRATLDGFAERLIQEIQAEDTQRLDGLRRAAKRGPREVHKKRPRGEAPGA